MPPIKCFIAMQSILYNFPLLSFMYLTQINFINQSLFHQTLEYEYSLQEWLEDYHSKCAHQRALER